jgi:AcrR family transcriptional regulator
MARADRANEESVTDPNPAREEGEKAADRGRGGDRRRELVRIAYRQLADKGFEGLRVRDVAAEAGINNATLHYYFPTKEALIQGVVEHLMEEFATPRAVWPDQEAVTPLVELRRELEDVRDRVRESPAMFIVLNELSVRSLRDPALARVLAYLEQGWRGYLMSILQRGIRQGVFRPDLDPEATATAIMAQMRAIAYEGLVKPDEARLDRLVTQFVALMERSLIP